MGELRKEIKLSKSQKMLMRYWEAEVKAIQANLSNSILKLSNEILNLIVDNIAMELNINHEKYRYDIQSKSFKLKKEELNNVK